MEIILMASTTGRVRQLRLRRWQLWWGIPALILSGVVAVLAAIWMVIWLVPGASEAILLPLLNASTVAQREDSRHTDPMEALVRRMGQMEGELKVVQLQQQALAQQQGLSLTRPAAVPPAVGGPEVPLTPAMLQQQLGKLEEAVARAQSDQQLLQSWTAMQTRQQYQLPELMPVNIGEFTSNFGPRSDPFSRRQAMHEGIDFAAPVGTSIQAAGAGTVIYAGYHHDYGYMVEIDHGHGITSRYAHASRLLVQMGDHVQTGDEIAKVGSTGRSTGSHLHFEVRFDGVAQNPSRFIPGSAG
ncbi:M23 family metallopeptidase [Leeia sp.]|uniref:M23 family metallopeptidase n=1 Tax=Leeia sp. TaxID=2884678 RepID=UPI0035B077D4